MNVGDNVRENYIPQDGCVQESIANDPMMLYLSEKATSPFSLLLASPFRGSWDNIYIEASKEI